MERGKAIQILREIFEVYGESILMNAVSLKPPKVDAAKGECMGWEVLINANLDEPLQTQMAVIAGNYGVRLKQLRPGYWSICAPQN